MVDTVSVYNNNSLDVYVMSINNVCTNSLFITIDKLIIDNMEMESQIHLVIRKVL